MHKEQKNAFHWGMHGLVQSRVISPLDAHALIGLVAM